MESSRRILALWLPLLSTDRLKRRWKLSGRLDNRPLVVAGKIGNAFRLTAVDEHAAKLGLYIGKALADARAMIRDIAVVRTNEPADLKLLDALAGWCERYTPLVALDSPHGLFLDITGTAHLFGDEQAMMKEIHRAISRKGFSARLALAGTTEAARALAHYRSGAIVPPGREAEVIADLPVEALKIDPVIIHALKRAGLKTIGQVTERQRHELRGRFGSGFIALLDRMLGCNGLPITPRRSLPDLMAERHFAEPVVTQEIISETLQSLVQSLVPLLEKRGQGARVLEAVFFRADGETRRIAIETGQTTRDPRTFSLLFREKLDALSDPLDPGFGFDLIRLCVTFAQNLEAEEAAGFDTNSHDKAIALLADKLAARFGAHRVLRFQPQETHIPEAAAVAVPAQSAKERSLPWRRVRAREDAPRRPLRLFEKPEPVEMIAQGMEGAPVRFRWRHVLHTVLCVEGPERIAMEWWRHPSPQPTRDYFRVQDERGRRFWLYRDGIAPEIAYPRWYVHGLFA